jgi:hypothetical protein
MKIIAMLVLVCSFGVSAAEAGKTLAQEVVAKKESSIHVVVTASVFSEYLNKFGIVAHDRMVTPVDVTVSVRAPLGTVYTNSARQGLKVVMNSKGGSGGNIHTKIGSRLISQSHTSTCLQPKKSVVILLFHIPRLRF